MISFHATSFQTRIDAATLFEGFQSRFHYVQLLDCKIFFNSFLRHRNMTKALIEFLSFLKNRHTKWYNDPISRQYSFMPHLYPVIFNYIF